MNNKKPIYLDNMASTPLDPAVAKKLQAYLEGPNLLGNPHSAHYYGDIAKRDITKAKLQIAKYINASENEIIFTSGATEANNLAIIGVAKFYSRKGKHIISCQTEHKSVLEPIEHLEDEGFTSTIIRPNNKGLISVEDIKQAITKETILISIMHVNNEIGVIQPIKEIGELAEQHGIIFHVDGTQSIGKLPIDVVDMKIGALSISGHKAYGPLGVGALYIRQKPRIRLQPMIYGGGQQYGIRPGTMATHLVVALGEAVARCSELLTLDQKHISGLYEKFIQNMKKINGWTINGCTESRVRNNINLSLEGLDGEALLCALRNIAISTASACVTTSQEGSYVLRAIGLSDEVAQSSIRISFGRFTTMDEVNTASQLLTNQVTRLREISGWDKP